MSMRVADLLAHAGHLTPVRSRAGVDVWKTAAYPESPFRPMRSPQKRSGGFKTTRKIVRQAVDLWRSTVTLVEPHDGCVPAEIDTWAHWAPASCPMYFVGGTSLWRDGLAVVEQHDGCVPVDAVSGCFEMSSNVDDRDVWVDWARTSCPLYFVDHGSLWRHTFASQIQKWIDAPATWSQRHLWDFIDGVGLTDANRCAAALTSEWAKYFDSTKWSRKDPAQEEWLFFDGPHGLIVPKYRDLSSKDVRSILGSLVKELQDFESGDCIEAIISHVREALSREVTSRATWRSGKASTCVLSAPLSLASTRDRVSTFTIHTGNSPPRAGIARPAIGRALVSFTAPWKVGYGSIRRRQNSGNLQHALRCGCPRAHLRGSTRAHAASGSRSQSSGRSYYGSNSSLAQCA
jgi:hypothetical protein